MRIDRKGICFAGAVSVAVINLLSLVTGVYAADRLRVATGGFSPSVPPFLTYAKPQLLKQDIEIEDVLMSGGSLSAPGPPTGAGERRFSTRGGAAGVHT